MSFVTPQWWVLTGSLVMPVVLGLVVFGLRRQPMSRRRFGGVLALNVLAASALWGLLVQPLTRGPAAPKIELLTPGYSGTPPADRGRRQVVLDGLDIYPLLQSRPQPTGLVVKGHGLPLSSWPLTRPELDVEFSPLPAGPVDLQWQRQLVLGEALSVSGRVQGFAQTVEYLSLNIHGLERDRVTPGPTGDFHLRDRVSFAGRLEYSLAAYDANNSALFIETVPVEVLPPTRPTVMLALSVPSFEAQALQRWLMRSAAGLRSTVALGAIQRTLVFGEPPSETAWLEQPQQLDLLVTDSTWLNDLAAVAVTQLEQAVAEGLGLLILPALDSAVAKSPLLKDFVAGVASTSAVQWTNAGETVELQLAGVRAGAGRALLRADDGQSLAVAVRRGSGQVALSLVHDSYTLNRLGQQEAYGRLWAQIVNGVIRQSPPEAWVERPLPALEQLEWLHLCNAATCQRRVLTQAGWQRLDLASHSVWAYAHPQGAWSAWRATERRRQTRLAAGLANVPGPSVSTHNNSLKLPLMVFFLITIAAIWLEQKTRRM